MEFNTLTDEMIEAGAVLVEKLDQSERRPHAAFWLYIPDLQQWKLMLAPARLMVLGPKYIYKEIQKMLAASPDELGALSLDCISLVMKDLQLVTRLAAAIATGRGISRIRLTNCVINGIVIEKALIYRLP